MDKIRNKNIREYQSSTYNGKDDKKKTQMVWTCKVKINKFYNKKDRSNREKTNY